MSYMASPTELSLDYKPHSLSTIQNQNPFADQRQKLQHFIHRLEEERLKIEAFKRELPLCMQLLNNAMEAYRRQLEAYQSSQGSRAVLEEFIPLKNMSIGESTEKLVTEKASWMVSAQLWSDAVSTDASGQEASLPDANETIRNQCLKAAAENSFSSSSKQRSGGAFHPFSKEKSCCKETLPPPPAVCPSATDEEEMEEKWSEIENGVRGDQRRESCSKSSTGGDQQLGNGGGGGVSGDGSPSTTAHRKARRCWSPDLHRRFVNALQILGGSQVATPKQIRELMKVDGLTNDEVKSHLQAAHKKADASTPGSATAAASATGGVGRHMGPAGIRHFSSSGIGVHTVWPSPLAGSLCPTPTAPTGILRRRHDADAPRLWRRRLCSLHCIAGI